MRKKLIFSERLLFISLLIAIGGIFIFAVSVISVSNFSPDSWSYFELSKNIFSQKFYQFNTFRSYFSDSHSAAFPFGYPTALAIIHLIAGDSPVAAIYFNIAVAIATGFLLLKISSKLGISMLSGFAISCALLFYPYYIDEIYSGRSIPLSIFCIVFAGFRYLNNSYFIAGLFLGLAALVRFDILLYSIAFAVVAILINKKSYDGYLPLALGFFLGVLPWVYYSQIYFDKLWVSDNSWVAMSVMPAFVLDYPAAPVVSASDDVFAWLLRLAKNVIPLCQSIIYSIVKFPLLLVLLIVIFINPSKLSEYIDRDIMIIFAILFFCIAPYVLTGYYDSRYFALFFMCLAVVAIYALNKTYYFSSSGVLVSAALVISILAAIGIGSRYLSRLVVFGYQQAADMDAQFNDIKDLEFCHKINPSVVYIFKRKSIVSPFKYGALTGMRSAALPSNFIRMSDSQKNNYLLRMSPYVFVGDFSKGSACPN